jgi:hypothetical protein
MKKNLYLINIAFSLLISTHVTAEEINIPECFKARNLLHTGFFGGCIKYDHNTSGVDKYFRIGEPGIERKLERYVEGFQYYNNRLFYGGVQFCF